MKSLIGLMLEKKYIDEDQLAIIQTLQKTSGKLFSDLITELGFVSEEDFQDILANFLKIPLLNTALATTINQKVLEFLSYDFVKKHRIFPICMKDDCFELAMVNPLDLITRDIVRSVVNKPIKPFLSTQTEIDYLIGKHYSAKDEYNIDSLLKEISTSSAEITTTQNKSNQELGRQVIDTTIDKENDSQVVKLVNIIFGEAVRLRATDVHVDPQEKYVDVRFRVDGTLNSIIKVPNVFRASLAARIKIVTCLNIAENRASQDGRASIFVSGKKIDIRIATIPTFYGEKITMRLLDQSQAKIEFSRIGLAENEIQLIKDAVSQPQGIILTTGPTGSGKTSTLYSALNHLRNTTSKHIVTIEDPVEYLLDGINQIQVNPVKNITFSTGLRSILRQDPNVILIGEIRDRETADIAFRASLTGHLVLSTLHTNSASATITRLLDIGLEPYLIGSTLSLIIAQRLIKKICPNCMGSYQPESNVLNKFKLYIYQLNIKKFYKGNGCSECNNTGYLGRTAIFEILKINDKIKGLIAKKAPEDAIYHAAKSNGLRTLVDAGMEKVALQLTTLEEIIDVLETSGVTDQTALNEEPGLSNRIVKMVFDEKELEDIYEK